MKESRCTGTGLLGRKEAEEQRSRAVRTMEMGFLDLWTEAVCLSEADRNRIFVEWSRFGRLTDVITDGLVTQGDIFCEKAFMLGMTLFEMEGC